MSKITITQALAECTTIGKRISKKQKAIIEYVGRQSGARDPLEKDGGSAQYIRTERQAMKDLQERLLSLRRAVATANENTEVAVGKEARTIADWLIWRREILPIKKQQLNELRGSINALRNEAQRRGVSVTEKETENFQDIVVNVNEKELLEEIESLDEIEGALDGTLSMHNALTKIDL